MAQIPPLDYAFLLVESEESPKHVGPVEVLSPPEGASDNYVSQFVAKLRQRTPAPPFNYKLKAKLSNPLGLLPGLPSGDLPVPQWRVAPSIDMEHHVRHHLLPPPGNVKQLTEKVNELHRPMLERNRPLWECHVIEGFQGGKQFVVYTKIHHAIVDGMMATTLLDVNSSKVPGLEAGKAFWELPDGWTAPERSENSLDSVKGLAKSLIDSSTLTAEMYMSVLQSGVGALLKGGSKSKATRPFSAAPTLLDRQPDAWRSLYFGKLPLADVKTISKAAGVSINDLLLTILDMAVGRYLIDLGEKPKKRLVALMPMTLRTEIKDSSEGNSVCALPVKLGRAKDTPLNRLRRIVAETAAQKEARDRSSDAVMASSLVTGVLAQVGEDWKLTGNVAPLGNFVYSNVPGPRETRYLFDAKVEEIYPISCLGAGAALNITSYSYDGQIYFQFIALEKAAPDLDKLMTHAQKAFQELGHAVREALVAAVAKGEAAAAKSAAKKSSVKSSARKTATKPAEKKSAMKSSAKKAATKPAEKKSAVKSSAKKTATKPAAKNSGRQDKD